MANLSLRILNKNPYPIDNFLHNAIIPEYKRVFRGKLKRSSILLLNQQLEKVLGIKKINSKKILLDSLNYLIVTKDANLYIVHFDNNEKIPQLDMTYDSFISMISYGTSEITSFPVYIESFDFIRKYYSTIKHRFFGG